MDTFTTYLNNIENRIDPNPYKPARLEIIRKIKTSGFKLLSLKEAAVFKRKIVSSSSNRPYVGLENVESNTGKYIPSEEKKEDFGTAFEFEKGDILFPKLRPYLNKVHLAEFDGVCSTEFYVLKAIKCNNEYLCYFLRTQIIVNQTSSLMTGNTLPRLQTDDVENLLIPILPEKKQIEIATTVRQAYKEKDILDKKAKEMLESRWTYLLDKLGIETIPISANKYGIAFLKNNNMEGHSFVSFKNELNERMDAQSFIPIYEKVSKLISSSKYTCEELANVCSLVQSGKAPMQYVEEGSHYLKVRNVLDLSFNWDTDKIKPEEIDENFLLKKGDIVLVTMGSGSLGKIAMFKEEFDCQFDPKLTRLRIKENHCADYVLFFMRTPYFQKSLEKYIRGSTGMSILNSKDVLQIKIPVPEYSIQKTLAKEIYQRTKEAEEFQIKGLEAINKSIKEIEKLVG